MCDHIFPRDVDPCTFAGAFAGLPTRGYIARSWAGWSLYADGGLVSSADCAADLWPLAAELSIQVTA